MPKRWIVVAAALAWAGWADAASTQAPKAAAAQPRTFTAEEMRAEFDMLYGLLEQSHYNLYARVTKRDYERLFRRMKADLDAPMTRAEAIRFFQRFVAFGKVAHARIDSAGDEYAAYRDAGGRVFPLGIRVKKGRVFIASNASGLSAVSPGDELLSLDGRPIRHWLDRVARADSADTHYMAHSTMEWRFTRLLWTEIGARPAFELKLRRAGGKLAAVTVPARTAKEMEAAAALQPPQLELSWEKREARMLSGGIAYLRPGPAYNVDGGEERMYDNREFVAFLDEAFQRFIAAGATDLLIDLRDNPGGDNSFTDHMIAWFADRPFRFNSSFRIKVSPATIASNARRLEVASNDPTGITRKMAEAYSGVAPGTIIDFPTPLASPRRGTRFEGRVYALINRHSYSNTVTVAATIQDYRFGTLIGEETSDLATTYGAMESFTLPRTGIAVGFPKAYIVRPNGNRRARGAVPDIAIETPVVESPDDPVLSRAVAVVRARSRR